MTTENKLVKQIIDYWAECIYDCESDYKINKLIDNYALSCGIDLDEVSGYDY